MISWLCASDRGKLMREKRKKGEKPRLMTMMGTWQAQQLLMRSFCFCLTFCVLNREQKFLVSRT